MARKDESNDADLKELRDEFTYAQTEKRDIVREAAEDMRVIGGDVWNPEDRKAREEMDRPVLSLDEAGQYVNQLINGIRQNKRSIKVAPQGRGATDKTADFRQNLIRQIEYRSNAQQGYAVMAENAFQRSYGYLRVVPEYVNHESFDQELRIKGVPNPDMVTEDPAAQRTDGGDWQFLYFGELWQKAKFKRRWPNAKEISFDMATKLGASDWIKANSLLVAERWRVITKPRKLLLVQPAVAPHPGLTLRAPAAPVPYTVFEDKLEGGKLPAGASVLKDRMVDYPSVKKQIVNGVEILEETDFPGTSIPFIACYGKVIYVNEEKRILSLIRLARDPMMLYCFYRTQQAEMASMIPKTPIGGYRGQFAGLETDYQKLPHEPLAFVEFNFTAEGWNPQWGPMPPPQRLGTSVGEHLQALELCAEGARRAIQAAIGSSPLPTQAQRRNEKSGIALQTIESAEERGSFHFIDHFDDALMRTGAILDELIPHYYDAARDVTVRKPDDQPAVVRINDPADETAVSATEGDHDVTLSVGPYQASERQAASDFADTLIGSQLISLMPPPLALKIVSMAVRLKSVGPIGDEIADLLSPKEEEGQGPTPQQVQQMQGQIQELTAKLQQAAQALETDQAKEQARVEIEKIKADVAIELQKMKDATAIRVKEIDAEMKGIITGHEAQHEAAALHTELAHDAAEAERQRQHEAGLTAMQAEHQAQAAERGHGQALEAGEIEAQRAAAAAAAAEQGGV